ncbi:MAG: hypothetical protein U0V56_10225 [Actinomycetota bacterium]
MTRYLVALDEGRSLVVMRQNLDTSSMEAQVGDVRLRGNVGTTGRWGRGMPARRRVRWTIGGGAR